MANNLPLQLSLAGTLLFVVLTFFIVYFFIVQRMKMNRHFLEKQQLLLEIKNKELSVRFEERELMMTEVSKEVHDNVGQIAHLIRMHLYEIEEHISNEYPLKLIQYISGLTDQLITHTHHISHSLNSNFIKERGLPRVLEDDLEQIKTSTNIACYLHVVNHNDVLTPEEELLVYRIAQEAVHNTLKHATASLLEITLTYSESGFTMSIHDNGVGFHPESIKEKNTIGLRNMKERSKLLNGDLQIKSGNGIGCTVLLSVDQPLGDE